MLNVDDLLKILLVGSISFSIAGISIQIMRLLGTTNSIMQDSRKIITEVNEILKSVKDDYKGIMLRVNGILDMVDDLKTDIIDPLYDLTYSALDKAKNFLGVLKKKI